MTPDLQRALAEIDRMIEEAESDRRFAAHRGYGHSAVHCTDRIRILTEARSRLSALATTTHGEQG